MFRNILIIGTTATVILSATAAAWAVCDNGVCVEGRDDGRTLNVYVKTEMSGITHYNVRVPGRAQFESTGQFSIPVQQGQTYDYSVQACKRGGTFQKSICTQWANFHHNCCKPH
jgi:hypothetical protein